MTDPRIMILDPDNYRTAAPRLTGIACTPDDMIFGDEGLARYTAARGATEGEDWEDGRYFAVLETPSVVKAFTDPMGQDTLYYYAASDPEKEAVGDWLVSNSLYELALAANRMGKPITFLSHVAASHFISNGAAFGAQLVSNQTAIRQIKVLPIGCELHISKRDSTLRLIRTRAADWLIGAEGSYEDLIEVFVTKTCARIRAVVESGHFDVFADLSGGHDSRANFGMARRAEVADQLTFFTNAALKDDFASVMAMKEAFDFDLVTSPQVERLGSPEDLYHLWKQSGLGVYTSIYAGTIKQDTRAVRLHGGNFLSKEFGEKSARSRAQSIARSMPQEQLAERTPRVFLKSFHQMGLETTHPWAMQLHYLNFRGRFHYGRNWAGTGRSINLTPLISQHFARAAFKLSQHEYNTLKPCMDLLLALDGKLAAVPFDMPSKSFPAEILETSPFWNRPLGFSASSLKLPGVFAGPRTETRVDKDHPKTSLKALVRDDLERYLPVARSTRMFTRDYILSAKADLKKPGSFPHNARKAAHIISTGALMELQSA